MIPPSSSSLQLQQHRQLRQLQQHRQLQLFSVYMIANVLFFGIRSERVFSSSFLGGISAFCFSHLHSLTLFSTSACTPLRLHHAPCHQLGVRIPSICYHSHSHRLSVTHTHADSSHFSHFVLLFLFFTFSFPVQFLLIFSARSGSATVQSSHPFFLIFIAPSRRPPEPFALYPSISNSHQLISFCAIFFLSVFQ